MFVVFKDKKSMKKEAVIFLSSKKVAVKDKEARATLSSRPQRQ